MKEIIQAIFPPDTPAILRWRLSMAGVAALGVIHIAWACGLLSQFGLYGFVKADSLDKRVAETKSELNAIRDQIKELSQQIVLSLAATKAGELRTLTARRCTASTAEKEVINRELDIKQDEYYKLMGRLYVVPTCLELK